MHRPGARRTPPSPVGRLCLHAVMAGELDDVSVFVDFDGTITTSDAIVHLLNTIAGDTWRVIEHEYESGAIGTRECLQREWDLLAATDEARIRAIADEVGIDPGFETLVAYARAAGAEIAVLSDGY